MKHVDICLNCYAHLIDNTINLYVDNDFTEMLFMENIDDFIPSIIRTFISSSSRQLFCIISYFDFYSR